MGVRVKGALAEACINIVTGIKIHLALLVSVSVSICL